MRGFLSEWIFSNFVKSTRGILIKRVRKLHRQLAHDGFAWLFICVSLNLVTCVFY